MYSNTPEERALAALSHAGIVLNSFNLLGVVGATLIWATHRERSRYVAEHAMHALVFQVCSLLMVMLIGFVWGSCLLLSFLPAILRPELYRTDPPVTFWLALSPVLVILLVILMSAVYGLAGAWAAWNGRAFHYGPVGRFIKQRTMNTDQAPEHEEANGSHTDSTTDEQH